MSRYGITEEIRILNEPHVIEMERNEQFAEDADPNAPMTIETRRSLFEVGKIFSQVLPKREEAESDDNPGHQVLSLRKASDAISVVRHGWRYRAPMSIVMELIIDSNEALEAGKKKQPDTPSSSDTDSPSPTTSTKNSKKKKRSKSLNDSASAPLADSASTSPSKENPAEP